MLNTILGILILVMSVFLVVTILLQSSKDHRMSGTIAGGAETFFGKQKGKTIDGFLNKLTVVVCILFFVVVLVMYIAQPEIETNYLPDDIEISDVEGEVADDAVVEDTADAETDAADDGAIVETEPVDDAAATEDAEESVQTGDNEVSF